MASSEQAVIDVDADGDEGTVATTALDEQVSQFLSFTGSADTERATAYLEMCGGNVETAVGLFLEHAGGAGDSTSAAAASNRMDHSSSTANMTTSMGGNVPSMEEADAAMARALGQPGGDVRAPDQTRTMRLMDFDDGPPFPGMMGPGGAAGMMGMMMPPPDDGISQMSAFASAMAGSSRSTMDRMPMFDARAAVNAAAAHRYDNEDDDDDYEDEADEEKEDEVEVLGAMASSSSSGVTRLEDMFAPPTNLMHRAGGFQGARSVARDSRRWMLVNLQRDSEFSCHALNRDVWRNELVENLVRAGFIFWQAMDESTDGRTYAERYGVTAYPHIAIIDPRTGRLMWKKEGWTQVNPMTSETFTNLLTDFCSRHSFEDPPKLPQPRQASTSSSSSTSNGSGPRPEARPNKRPMREMTEEQQLQAAIRASMNESIGKDEEEEDFKMSHDDEDEMDEDENVVCLDKEVEQQEEPPSLAQELALIEVGEEPEGTENVARIQIRMPDGKRLVRKFRGDAPVKTVYAFVAQSNEEAKGGKEFELKAGFPPKDLCSNMDDTIQSCGLAGDSITVRWK